MLPSPDPSKHASSFLGKVVSPLGSCLCQFGNVKGSSKWEWKQALPSEVGSFDLPPSRSLGNHRTKELENAVQTAWFSRRDALGHTMTCRAHITSASDRLWTFPEDGLMGSLQPHCEVRFFFSLASIFPLN